MDGRYLRLLSEKFPDIVSAKCEIARLRAKTELPKRVELFASDIHGEFNAFALTVKSACGLTRVLIDKVFPEFDEEERAELLTLVCYPDERMDYLFRDMDAEEEESWTGSAIESLITLLYAQLQEIDFEDAMQSMQPSTRAMATDLIFALHADPASSGSRFDELLEEVLEAGLGSILISDIAKTIRYLAVVRVHLVGDVFDRGPAPEKIMDMLANFPSLDIQWGNHEIVWMGAALGQLGCIAHVVRNCARYGNLSILEDAYGINLRPLTTFAMKAYGDDPCVAFSLKGEPDLSPEQELLNIKVQKAMAVIQFKIEGQIIDEHPEYGLDDRKLLHLIDHEKGTVMVDGTEYELVDTVFPTLDPNDPYRLTDEELSVIGKLASAFIGSERLQRHMALLVRRGSMYKIQNDVLMFHACVPLNEDGSFKEIEIDGIKYSGKALYDAVEAKVKNAFAKGAQADQTSKDMLWYLWLGPGSPLFAKSKMATFELYLIEDKAARKEVRNSFYNLLDDKKVIDSIFRDFGMDPRSSHMVCGHVPVKVKDGETPIRGAGRVLMIDGGYSLAYQKTTGIAGMALIHDDHGLTIAQHSQIPPFKEIIQDCSGMQSRYINVTDPEYAITIGQTDEGRTIRQDIESLETLVRSYETGLLGNP